MGSFGLLGSSHRHAGEEGAVAKRLPPLESCNKPFRFGHHFNFLDILHKTYRRLLFILERSLVQEILAYATAFIQT